MADVVSILVRVRDETARGITSVNDNLHRLTRNANKLDKDFGSLTGAALSFAPALIPIAASIAPITAGFGAGTVAVAAFGAALGPQISAMGDAADAERKYTEAVEKNGESSKEAVKAQAAYLAAVEKLPPATREAAAALSVMKEQYKDWSESLADDTVPVLTKGMANLTGLFPKLTPTVKGASQELDRFMTITGGGIESAAFERFMQSFADFSTGSLRKANDGLIRFSRTLDTGTVGGDMREFMDYARTNAPLVGETLGSLADALTNLVVASADTGVGMLQVINGIAGIVAALPTGLVTTLLQVAIAFKLIKMGAAGFAVVARGIQAMTVQIIAMRTAAGAATGGMAGFTAAIGAMSRMAKVAVAATGIGLLVIAISELGQVGKRAPADMDKLTTSLVRFGDTGKLTGESARILGKDFGEFDEALRGLARPGQWDQIQQGFTNLFGQDSTPVKRWKETLGDVDTALADLVKSGNADQAAAAFEMLAKRANSEGLTTAELRKELGDYQQALADVEMEQRLAADAMGLYGQQAQEVQAKLDAQKTSADALAQSINALNNQQLIARGGMRGLEAAIDAASEALKENGRTLDIGTEKGRANQQALDDLASATMKAAEFARENGASWSEVNSIYDTGRAKLIAVAQQMGMNKDQAKALADQILKTPDKTARLKGNMQDLQAKLDSAKRQLARVPDSRKARVTANIDALNYALAKARDKLNALDGKTVTTYVVTQHSSTSGSGLKELAFAHGGVVGAAGGGPRSRMTLVGEQGPELVDLAPGSRVRSNPDTRRMLTAGGGGGSSQPLVILLDLAGERFAELLIDPLTKVIRSRGGNVQAVIGQKGK